MKLSRDALKYVSTKRGSSLDERGAMCSTSHAARAS